MQLRFGFFLTKYILLFHQTLDLFHHAVITQDQTPQFIPALRHINGLQDSLIHSLHGRIQPVYPAKKLPAAQLKQYKSKCTDDSITDQHFPDDSA